MWGGKGDDTMRGGSIMGGTNMVDVLWGGDGDDLMYGGFDF